MDCCRATCWTPVNQGLKWPTVVLLHTFKNGKFQKLTECVCTVKPQLLEKIHMAKGWLAPTQNLSPSTDWGWWFVFRFAASSAQSQIQVHLYSLHGTFYLTSKWQGTDIISNCLHKYFSVIFTFSHTAHSGDTCKN